MRWEYFFVEGDPLGRGGDQFQRDLSQLGSQGWEIVSVVGERHKPQLYVLKREAPA